MFLILVFELALLFFLSKSLTSHLSLLFYKIFKSQKVSIILMAGTFFIGTLIHEISHFLVAKILFVNTFGMELVPKLTGESLKLGSVKVAKTDLVRNFFIGTAPFIVGLALIFTTLYYAFLNNIFGFNFFTIVVLYFLFVVSNTMFSSKKDMEGAVEFIILLLVFIAFLYFLGVRLPIASLRFFDSFSFQKFLQTVALLLVIPIILDIVVIFLSKVFVSKVNFSLD